MADPRIELHVEPGVPVDARAFAEALSAFVPLVREADPKATWIVDDLRNASAHVALTAPGASPQVQTALNGTVDGLIQLRARASIPDGFTAEMVRWARRLAQSSRGVSVTSTDVRAELDEAVARHAGEALAGQVESIGGVEGVFDRLTERGGQHEVGLIDRTGTAVSCTFDDTLRDDVIDAFRAKQRVVAWGRLHRNAAGQKTGLDMWDIEPVESETAKSITELVGILGPGWKGDLNSVDFVRAQRDS